jgi:hypothetical protein
MHISARNNLEIPANFLHTNLLIVKKMSNSDQSQGKWESGFRSGLAS